MQGVHNVKIKNKFRMFKVCRYGKVMVQKKESRNSNWSLVNNVKVLFYFHCLSVIRKQITLFEGF